MAWIESHQSLGTHLKLRRLARELRIHRAQAIGHLHFLWWWALDNAPTGNLSALAPAEIAEVAEWPGSEDQFLAALKSCGWIEESGEIHDWADYAGKIVASRQGNRERQRRARERNASVTRDVTLDSPLRNALVTGLPNPTLPNPTLETHPHASAGACVRAGKWPTLKECLSTASMRGIPSDCAEKWWMEHDARGGRDKGGQPVERWESCLQGYFVGWRANGNGHKPRTATIGTDTPADSTF